MNNVIIANIYLIEAERNKEGQAPIGKFKDTDTLCLRDDKDIPRGMGQHIAFTSEYTVDPLKIDKNKYTLFISMSGNKDIVPGGIAVKTIGEYYEVFGISDKDLWYEQKAQMIGDRKVGKIPKTFIADYTHRYNNGLLHSNKIALEAFDMIPILDENGCVIVHSEREIEWFDIWEFLSTKNNGVLPENVLELGKLLEKYYHPPKKK